MGKVLGALARLCLALFILALLGYNTWGLARLRADVERLKRQTSTIGRAGVAVPEAPDRVTDRDTGALLARARRHAERAQALLRNKQYTGAEAELAQAARLLGTASRQVQGRGASALGHFRQALSSLSRQAEALWERQDGKESGKRP